MHTRPVLPQYAALARTPRGTLAVYPLGEPTTYFLWQRAHERPLVNGSGAGSRADDVRLTLVDPGSPGTAERLALLGVTSIVTWADALDFELLRPHPMCRTHAGRRVCIVKRFPDGCIRLARDRSTGAGSDHVPRGLERAGTLRRRHDVCARVGLVGYPLVSSQGALEDPTRPPAECRPSRLRRGPVNDRSSAHARGRRIRRKVSPRGQERASRRSSKSREGAPGWSSGRGLHRRLGDPPWCSTPLARRRLRAPPSFGPSRSRATGTVSRSAAIVANGFADGPAQALHDYLVGRGVRVVAAAASTHPEQGRRIASPSTPTALESTLVRSTCDSRPQRRSRSILSCRFASRVSMYWFGFNPLACARGLVARRLGGGRSCSGPSTSSPIASARSPLTTLYNTLDRLSARTPTRSSSARTTRFARTRHHRIERRACRPASFRWALGSSVRHGCIVRTPTGASSSSAISSLGEACPCPRGGRVTSTAEIASRSTSSVLASRALLYGRRELALPDAVEFHGFVPDHSRVERLLATSSLAVAPYAPTRRRSSLRRSGEAQGLPRRGTADRPDRGAAECGRARREAGAEVVTVRPRRARRRHHGAPSASGVRIAPSARRVPTPDVSIGRRSSAALWRVSA